MNGEVIQPGARGAVAPPVWRVRTPAEIAAKTMPDLPDGNVYGWMTTGGVIYAGEGYPVPVYRFALDNEACAALMIAAALPAAFEPAPTHFEKLALRLDMVGNLEDDDAALLAEVAALLRALPSTPPAADAGDARLREALTRSREGWVNVVEFDLLPPQHRETAQRLIDDAAAALRDHGEAGA